MKAYLKSQISDKDLFLLIQQLIEAIEEKKEQGMRVVLDFDKIGYNNQLLQVQTVSEDAILEFETIKAFIREMTFSAVFSEEGNYQEITEFLKYLDDTYNCRTIQDIYEFCVDETFEEGPLNLTENAESEDQNDETGVLDPSFWNRINQQMPVQNGQVKEKTFSNDARIERKQSVNEGETGVLDPSFWNQINQGGMKPAQQVRETKVTSARLSHTKSGQTVQINQNEFWIGKDNCDLTIAKPTVSRKHAVIQKNGDHYFISDNGSTNKTYVRNQAIQAKASVEIYHGDRIKFANEEYEFQIIS